VFIGEKVSERAVNGVFDKRRLTDGEMRRWERVWGMRNVHSSNERIS